MSAEQLHNALNDLDDDLIEAVEALRSRKKKTFPIFRLAGLAACLCLLAGIGFWHFGAPGAGNTQMETANDHFYSQEYAPAETVAPIDMPTVLVAVTEYTPEGFTATVTDPLDTDLFPTGTSVTVYLPPAAETTTAGSGDELLYGAAKDPTLNFSAGTVQVCFIRWEETEDGIVIYAKQIIGGQE